MIHSRASEALFLFIRLFLAGSVVFGTYPSKIAVGGIIKKCGIIKRFISSNSQTKLEIKLYLCYNTVVNQRRYSHGPFNNKKCSSIRVCDLVK